MYTVYADGKPTGFHHTLEAAKAAAMLQAGDKRIHIESLTAPAPSRFWLYDRENKVWVETDLEGVQRP